jgi:hypothetical protein
MASQFQHARVWLPVTENTDGCPLGTNRGNGCHIEPPSKLPQVMLIDCRKYPALFNFPNLVITVYLPQVAENNTLQLLDAADECLL